MKKSMLVVAAVLCFCGMIPALAAAAGIPDSLQGLDMAAVEQIDDYAAADIRGESLLGLGDLLGGLGLGTVTSLLGNLTGTVSGLLGGLLGGLDLDLNVNASLMGAPVLDLTLL